MTRAQGEDGRRSRPGRGLSLDRIVTTALELVDEQGIGAHAAQHGGDLQAIFLGILNVAVGQIKGFAMRYAEDFGGGFRLGGSLFGGAPGASLATREIEDAGAPTQGVLDKKRSAARLLDVIAMRSDGKDVEALARTCVGRERRCLSGRWRLRRGHGG